MRNIIINFRSDSVLQQQSSWLSQLWLAPLFYIPSSNLLFLQLLGNYDVIAYEVIYGVMFIIILA